MSEKENAGDKKISLAVQGVGQTSYQEYNMHN